MVILQWNPTSVVSLSSSFLTEYPPFPRNYPIGVLFDQYVVSVQDPQPNTIALQMLPWNITVHYTGRNETGIIEAYPDKLLKHMVVSAAKEVFFKVSFLIEHYSCF